MPIDMAVGQAIGPAVPLGIAYAAARGNYVETGGQGGRIAAQRQQQVGMFGFGVAEIVVAIQPEQGGNRVVAGAGKQMQRPIGYPRSKCQCGGSVADVVLAVTEGAFTVFPRFAPVDRTQPQQRRYRRKQHL